MKASTVAAVALGGVATLALAYYLATRIPVKAYAIGIYTGINNNLVTYRVGDEIKIATAVPQNTQPISIQLFVNGQGYAPQPWDVSKTGYTYVIDVGPATPQQPILKVWTVVTFADGRTAKSNTITIMVAQTAAAPTQTSGYSADGSCGCGQYRMVSENEQ